MAEYKKEKLTNPFLIIAITVLFVLLLTFLIIFYDVWQDYAP